MNSAIHCYMRVSTRRVLALVAVALYGMMATTAPAQVRDASMLLNLSQPKYLHRDMPIFAQELNLDDGQRMILDSLFEDFRNAFEDGWQSTQASINESVSKQRDDVNRQDIASIVSGSLEDWHRAKQQLENQFDRDVQAILNEQQLQQWPAFERRIVRDKTLPYGRLSGESVDLIRIIRQLDLPPRTMRAIEPELDAYSRAMHNALAARNEVLAEKAGSMFRSLREPDANTDHVRKAEREVRQREQVREVNDRFIEQFAAALPQETAKEFKKEALIAAYPQAYQPIPAQVTYERAMKLDDLDQEILATIEDLYSVFMVELDVVNREMHEAVKRHEPNVMIHEAKEIEARENNEEVERLESPLRLVVRDREERANYYIGLLREFLTEEQFASIPGTQRWRYAERRAAMHRGGSRRGLGDRPPDRAKEARQRSSDRRQREQQRRQRSAGEDR